MRYAVGFGAFIWIVIDGTVALLLFLATLATFDRCLGRVSEVAGRSLPYPKKEPPPTSIQTLMSGLPRIPRRSRDGLAMIDPHARIKRSKFSYFAACFCTSAHSQVDHKPRWEYVVGTLELGTEAVELPLQVRHDRRVGRVAINAT